MVFTIASFAGPLLHASPWQRTADQRTALPEKVTASNRKNWGLDAALGYTQFSGNVEQTSANADITYFTLGEKSSFYWQTGAIYGLSKDVVTQNQGRTVFRYDWIQTEQFKYFAFNTHAFNKFLKINYRGTVGVGPWYDFIGDNWKNGISLAPTYLYENFDGYGNEQGWWMSLRNYYIIKVSESTTTGLDLFYLFRTNDPNDQQIFFQPFLEVAIKPDRLSLKISYVGETDTRPKPGVKSTDFNYYTTLVLKFGE